jgi:AcrR family transcriptional regulator
MAQKATFSKDIVLEAAYALTQEEGWESVTARSIARKLGSSTMPIYSSLKSMEDVECGVRERAEVALQEAQKRRYTDNPGLNIAIGYVAFAREEPHLFRFLYVERPRRMGAPELAEQSRGFRKAFGGSPALKRMIDSIPQLSSNPVILKSWIFVHGLATLVGSGALVLSEDRVRELLSEAGGAFVAYAAAHGSR